MVFGTKIEIQQRENEGVIQLYFYSDAEFERLLEMHDRIVESFLLRGKFQGHLLCFSYVKRGNWISSGEGET